MFKHFFASILIEIHQLTEDSKDDVAQLNTRRISQKDVESVLTSLDVTKATRPDNIGNLILKNLPCLSKSIIYFPDLYKQSQISTAV